MLRSIVLADLTNSSELMRTSPKTQAKRVGALGLGFNRWMQQIG